MSFREEYDEHQRSSGSGDFFKFKKDGDYVFRILTEPVKKVSRYGYGICYEGAPYCQKAQIDQDWQALQQKAVAAGKNPKDVKRPGVSVKWMSWAILREKVNNAVENSYVIFEMPGKIATPIREYMDSEDYGFKEWPMPYDITIKVKDAGQTSVEYTVLPARKNTPLTDEEQEAMAKLMSIQSIKERIQAKQKEKYESEGSATGTKVEYPTDDINPDDIPF